ncbi:amidohydrolase family protein [Nitratireductor sp. B36]|uniref:amidohydrolase family protein n=1 Tax=Nitratireductor sp. B36 TaxID=2762059 RepID=UPI001E57B50D|nr:amidohydrolase family protein [Nitratireductor sp. B36]MCC5781010.1 amidohydrolase family protein [Nitratireductor sp. B36]
MTRTIDPETERFLRDLAIVDAHHHYWDLSGPVAYPWLQTPPFLAFRYGNYGAIRKNYLPEDYRHDHGAHRIVADVHMEAEPQYGMACAEIDWLASLGEAAPWAAAAQIWLDSDDLDGQLEALARRALVRSVRHKPMALPREEARRGAAGSMDDPKWRDGYARLAATSLHFELQTPWWHLDAAADLARDFPETRIILNHCGLPAQRSDEDLAAWRAAIVRFADLENTVVKLSGIGLAPGIWPEEQNIHILRELITIFGPGRAMFASNFPVDRLCISFAAMFSAYKRAVHDLPRPDIVSLFSGCAAATYGLDIAEISVER